MCQADRDSSCCTGVVRRINAAATVHDVVAIATVEYVITSTADQGVVAITTVQDVIAATTPECVIAGKTGQGIGSAVTHQDVVQIVALAVDGCRAGERQVFDVATEQAITIGITKVVADAAAHGVDTAIGQFGNQLRRVGNGVGVVAVAVSHGGNGVSVIIVNKGSDC